MTRLELIIFRSAPFRRLFAFARRTNPPGFEGQSLFAIGKLFLKEVRSTKVNERASAVTYNFLMAIPPTLLFLFSLVPYLPLGNVQQTIIDTIYLVTPNNNVRSSLSSVVLEFMNNERRDILSFGILLTIFFSSNGMMGLMRTFDRSVPIYVKRSKLRRRWVALKLTFMLICVVIISLGLFIIQTNAVNDLLLRVFNSVYAVKMLSLLIVIMIIFCSVSIVYTYGPSLTNRFSFVSPGSVLATIASVITTLVFFYIIDNFINYNKVYGSIGTLIAFMIWMWLNTIVILLGYELNVSILLGKTAHKIPPENATG